MTNEQWGPDYQPTQPDGQPPAPGQYAGQPPFYGQPQQPGQAQQPGQPQYPGQPHYPSQYPAQAYPAQTQYPTPTPYQQSQYQQGQYPAPTQSPYQSSPTQNVPAPASVKSPSVINAFVRDLFDLDVTHVVTPKIARYVLMIGMGAALSFWLLSVFVLFDLARSTSVFSGQTETNGMILTVAMVDLIFGWVVALGAIGVLRVLLDGVLAQIRTSEATEKLLTKLSDPAQEATGQAADTAEAPDGGQSPA